MGIGCTARDISRQCTHILNKCNRMTEHTDLLCLAEQFVSLHFFPPSSECNGWKMVNS